MSKIESGMLTDGTAIGEGLATAVNRLKDAKTKSKVIILLTDGVNNAGAIAPLTAGEIAKTFGIRVYTIGVGTVGMAHIRLRQYLEFSTRMFLCRLMKKSVNKYLMLQMENISVQQTIKL